MDEQTAGLDIVIHRFKPQTAPAAKAAFSNHGERLVWFAVMFLATFGGAELGRALSFPNVFALYWPPSGIYLAALFLAPPRRWPEFIIASWGANFCSDVLFHGTPGLLSTCFWVANTIEAISGACVLRLCVGNSLQLNRVRDVVALVLTACFVGPVLGATVGAGAIVLSDLSRIGEFGSSWLSWWISSVLGILLVAPPIINFHTRLNRVTWRPAGRANEAACVLTCLVLTSVLVFHLQSLPIAFVALPVLLWAGLRLDSAGTLLCSTMLAIVTIASAVRGVGPFAIGQSLGTQIMITQGFLGFSALMTLLFAAVAQERRQALQQLKQQREELRALRQQLKRHAAAEYASTAYRRRMQPESEERPFRVVYSPGEVTERL